MMSVTSPPLYLLRKRTVSPSAHHIRLTLLYQAVRAPRGGFLKSEVEKICNL